MAHETTRRCSYTTDRLVVDGWHRLAERYGHDLVDVVGDVLTAETTRALPPEWQGDFDRSRTARWIEDRDAESPTLLVVEQGTGDVVGVMILFEAADLETRLDVRLGYVLAASSWGKGLASELVGGLIGWAETEPTIRSISAGLAPDNLASARVLRKHGFSPLGDATASPTYRLDLR